MRGTRLSCSGSTHNCHPRQSTLVITCSCALPWQLSACPSSAQTMLLCRLKVPDSSGSFAESPAPPHVYANLPPQHPSAWHARPAPSPQQPAPDMAQQAPLRTQPPPPLGQPQHRQQPPAEQQHHLSQAAWPQHRSHQPPLLHLQPPTHPQGWHSAPQSGFLPPSSTPPPFPTALAQPLQTWGAQGQHSSLRRTHSPNSLPRWVSFPAQSLQDQDQDRGEAAPSAQGPPDTAQGSQLPAAGLLPHAAAAVEPEGYQQGLPGQLLGMLDPDGKTDLREVEAALDGLLRSKFVKERERLHALLHHQHA